MKARRCSAEPISHLVQRAERREQSIRTRCRESSMTEPTCDRWRKQFGGMTLPDAQRLRELEQENTGLQRLLAERALAVDALKTFLGNQS